MRHYIVLIHASTCLWPISETHCLHKIKEVMRKSLNVITACQTGVRIWQVSIPRDALIGCSSSSPTLLGVLAVITARATQNVYLFSKIGVCFWVYETYASPAADERAGYSRPFRSFKNKNAIHAQEGTHKFGGLIYTTPAVIIPTIPFHLKSDPRNASISRSFYAVHYHGSSLYTILRRSKRLYLLNYKVLKLLEWYFI